MTDTQLQVVFGGGQVGHAPIAHLAGQGEAVRVVSLHRPAIAPEGVDGRTVDVTDGDAAIAAAEGAAVVRFPDLLSPVGGFLVLVAHAVVTLGIASSVLIRARPKVRRMTVTPDAAAAAVLESMGHLLASTPDGWVRSEAGCLGMAAGVPLPTLNGVLVESEVFDAGTVSGLLDEVAATGLPYCLQVRPSGLSDAAELAGARSMVLDEHVVPLMVLEDPGRLDAAQRVDGLVIRELSPTDADIHCKVAAGGFGAPWSSSGRWRRRRSCPHQGCVPTSAKWPASR